MRFWWRNRNWRPTPANIEITSPLSPAECHRRLTGRDTRRWVGAAFTNHLRLRGTVTAQNMSVRLRSASISGDIEADAQGTRIRLSVRQGLMDVHPVIEWAAISVLVAVPFVAYESARSGSLNVPGFLIFLAVAVGCAWYKELRFPWPAYPDTPDELARMLAGHLRGSVTESACEG